MIEERMIDPAHREAETGYVSQAIGPVIDVRFSTGYMPPLRNALKVV